MTRQRCACVTRLIPCESSSCKFAAPAGFLGPTDREWPGLCNFQAADASATRGLPVLSLATYVQVSDA